MQPAGEADLRDPHAHDTAYAELPVHAGGRIVGAVQPITGVPLAPTAPNMSPSQSG